LENTPHRILESTHLQLRAPEPADLDFIYAWENNTDTWLVSNTLTPFSRFVLARYIETAHLDIWEAKQLRLIIILKSQHGEGKPIGAIDLFDFDPFHMRAGIGILIADKEDRRKGYASEAIEILKEYAFETLGLHQLYCNITASNEISLTLFKKSGFIIAGLKKEWVRIPGGWEDEYFLQLIPGDSPARS
jgi:diamine N-acetyltransferase